MQKQQPTFEFGQMKIKQSNINIISKQDLKILQQQENRGISHDISQQQIKELVPEQLKKQIFSLNLNDGCYQVCYDSLGSHIFLSSNTGHIILFRLKDFELQAEKKLTESVTCCSFLNSCKLLAVGNGNQITIFDEHLLSLHNLHYGQCQGMAYMDRHMILASVHSKRICYTDITNGKLIKEIDTKQFIKNIRLSPSNYLILASFPNSSIINFYSPNRDQPLFALNTGMPVTDFAVNNKYLITISNNQLKIFDIRNFTGETLTAIHKCELTKICISQQDIMALQTSEKIIFVKLGLLLSCDDKSKIITNNQKQQCLDLSQFVIQSHPAKCNSMQFRPFFDDFALTNTNFEQILIPGSGNPDIDSYRSNIYQSTRQLNEKEVKDQLNRLPYELIGEDLLQQTEKLTSQQVVERRYKDVYDEMQGKRDDPPKSLVAKRVRREEILRMRKEIKDLASKIDEKKEGNEQGNLKKNYLDKFRKLGKK